MKQKVKNKLRTKRTKEISFCFLGNSTVIDMQKRKFTLNFLEINLEES